MDLTRRLRFYCAQDGSLTRKRRILPQLWKAKLRKIPLVCYEYDHLDRGQEEALFARVQKGVRLSSAEKLKATRGKWQGLADSIEREFNTVTHCMRSTMPLVGKVY